MTKVCSSVCIGLSVSPVNSHLGGRRGHIGRSHSKCAATPTRSLHSGCRICGAGVFWSEGINSATYNTHSRRVLCVYMYLVGWCVAPSRRAAHGRDTFSISDSDYNSLSRNTANCRRPDTHTGANASRYEIGKWANIVLELFHLNNWNASKKNARQHHRWLIVNNI